MSGKYGDNSKPKANSDEYRDNWDAIFGKKKKEKKKKGEKKCLNGLKTLL